MASSDEHNFTFLRGAGFLHSLVGAWDLIADVSSQNGFLIFKETKIIAVIERDEHSRRGIEGTYSVEADRIVITELVVDTAPEQGALGEVEFQIDGDILTVTWPVTWRGTEQTRQPSHQVDKFRRRAQQDDGAVLPPVAMYESDAPTARLNME